MVINLLLLPLRFTSLKSQRRMQRLQPQIAAINAKYKGLSLRDPKKAQQNQEVMELYKKEGVNPVGGCLPMLDPAPAPVRLLQGAQPSPSNFAARIGSGSRICRSLSMLPIHILPVIMIVSQFIVQQHDPNARHGPLAGEDDASSCR